MHVLLSVLCLHDSLCMFDTRGQIPCTFLFCVISPWFSRSGLNRGMTRFNCSVNWWETKGGLIRCNEAMDIVALWTEWFSALSLPIHTLTAKCRPQHMQTHMCRNTLRRSRAHWKCKMHPGKSLSREGTRQRGRNFKLSSLLTVYWFAVLFHMPVLRNCQIGKKIKERRERRK